MYLIIMVFSAVRQIFASEDLLSIFRQNLQGRSQTFQGQGRGNSRRVLKQVRGHGWSVFQLLYKNWLVTVLERAGKRSFR